MIEGNISTRNHRFERSGFHSKITLVYTVIKSSEIFGSFLHRARICPGCPGVFVAKQYVHPTAERIFNLGGPPSVVLQILYLEKIYFFRHTSIIPWNLALKNRPDIWYTYLQLIGSCCMAIEYIHNWLVVWNIFVFPYIGNNHPNWLIFFRRVETTNQITSHVVISWHNFLEVSCARLQSWDPSANQP